MAPAYPESGSSSPGVLGSLNRSLAEKQAQKYDTAAERLVRDWLATALAHDPSFATEVQALKKPVSSPQAFRDILMKGDVLCAAINSIAGTPLVGKIQRNTQTSFRYLENIENFLNACRSLGVSSLSLFRSIDLVEGKDMVAVLASLDSIRLFTSRKDQPAGKQSRPPAAKSQALPMAEARPVRSVTEPTPTKKPPAPGKQSSTPSKPPQSGAPTRRSSIPVHPPGLSVVVPPAHHAHSVSPVFRPSPLTASTDYSDMSATASPDASMPEMAMHLRRRSSGARSTDGAFLGGGLRPEPSVSSLQQDLQLKAMLKHDPALEAAARNWIVAVLEQIPEGARPTRDGGVPLLPLLPAGGSLHQQLKSGEVLCHLVNALRPGTIPRVHKRPIAFSQMENIEKYLESCALFGLSPADRFNTVDLFEQKGMNQVVANIHILSKHVQRMPGYQGPAMEATQRGNTLFSASLVEGYSLEMLFDDGLDEEIPLEGDAGIFKPGSQLPEPGSLAERQSMLRWVQECLALPLLPGSQLGDAPAETFRIRNLRGSMRSGVVLLRLFEAVSRTTVYSKVNPEPTELWHCTLNCDSLMFAISSQMFNQFDKCTTHDIITGNQDKIFELLKYIRGFDDDWVYAQLLSNSGDPVGSSATSGPTHSQPAAVTQPAAGPKADALPSDLPVLLEANYLEGTPMSVIESFLRQRVEFELDPAAGKPPREPAGLSSLRASLAGVVLLDLTFTASTAAADPLPREPLSPQTPKPRKDTNSQDSPSGANASSGMSAKRVAKRLGQIFSPFGRKATPTASDTGSAEHSLPPGDALPKKQRPHSMHVSSTPGLGLKTLSLSKTIVIQRTAGITNALNQRPSLRELKAALLAGTPSQTKPSVPPTTAPTATSGPSSKADHTMARNTAAELLQTEKIYCANIGLVIEHFYEPLLEAALSQPTEKSSKRGILSAHEHDMLFTSLKEIYIFQQTFLQSVEDLLRDWSETSHIGTILSDMDTLATMERVYAPYMAGYAQSSLFLEIIRRKNQAFARAVTAFESKHLAPSRLSLSMVLAMPFQRLPRYEMLLAKFDKYASRLPGFRPEEGRAATQALKSCIQRVDRNIIREVTDRCSRIQHLVETMPGECPVLLSTSELSGSVLDVIEAGPHAGALTSGMATLAALINPAARLLREGFVQVKRIIEPRKSLLSPLRSGTYYLLVFEKIAIFAKATDISAKQTTGRPVGGGSLRLVAALPASLVTGVGQKPDRPTLCVTYGRLTGLSRSPSRNEDLSSELYPTAGRLASATSYASLAEAACSGSSRAEADAGSYAAPLNPNGPTLRASSSSGTLLNLIEAVSSSIVPSAGAAGQSPGHARSLSPSASVAGLSRSNSLSRSLSVLGLATPAQSEIQLKAPKTVSNPMSIVEDWLPTLREFADPVY